MMEQPDVLAGGPSVPIVSLKLALSEEARASLEAVRVAQEGARSRARRQTMQARMGFALLVGAAGLAAVAFAPRVARWRQARAHASTPALARSAPPNPVPAAAVPAAIEGASANAPAASVRLPSSSEDSTTGTRPAVAARAKAGAGASGDEGCDMGSLRSAPWRLSAEACARVFESDPTNASLALAIAHSEHAHGRLPESAQWAKRALALDPNAAEAYVLVARAETADGHPEEARAAYRRYLELAPRGWHKSEARAALREASARPR